MDSKMINAAAAEVKKIIKTHGEGIISDNNRFFGIVSDSLTGEANKHACRLIQKGIFSGVYGKIINAPASQRRAEAGKAKQLLMNQEMMSEEFSVEAINILLGALDIKFIECTTSTVAVPEPERDPFECTGCGNKIQILGNTIPKFCNMCGTPWTAPANFDPATVSAPAPKTTSAPKVTQKSAPKVASTPATPKINEPKPEKRVNNTFTEAQKKQAEDYYKRADDYYWGQSGCAKDYKEAAVWYEKAANLGHAGAQCKLGDLYHYGRGLEKNYDKAAEWYEKSALQGYADAMCNLGLQNLYPSVWDNADREKGKMWLEKAAALNHRYAQREIASDYYYGTLYHKNYEKAAEWYKKAAENGDDASMEHLAHMYEYGEGVSKSLYLATYWYKKANADGWPGVKRYIFRCWIKKLFGGR